MCQTVQPNPGSATYPREHTNLGQPVSPDLYQAADGGNHLILLLSIRLPRNPPLFSKHLSDNCFSLLLGNPIHTKRLIRTPPITRTKVCVPGPIVLLPPPFDICNCIQDILRKPLPILRGSGLKMSKENLSDGFLSRFQWLKDSKDVHQNRLDWSKQTYSPKIIPSYLPIRI